MTAEHIAQCGPQPDGYIQLCTFVPAVGGGAKAMPAGPAFLPRPSESSYGGVTIIVPLLLTALLFAVSRCFK